MGAEKYLDKITYNNDTGKKIIELLKKHVKENGNCRVGWAAEYVLGSKQQNHVIQKISATFIKSGKYSRQPSTQFSNDYDVFLNPNHKNQLLHDFLVALFTAALTLLTGYILWRIDNQTKRQEMETVKRQLKDVTDQLNGLQKKIR